MEPNRPGSNQGPAVALYVIGAILLALGMVGLVLPGPGVLLLFAGVVCLVAAFLARPRG